MRSTPWLGCLAACLWLGAALAADAPKPAPAPTPTVVPAPPSPAPTLVHLAETADRKVPRDEFVAELAVEGTDADPRKLQAAINQAMAAALAQAKEAKGVSVETASYTVHRPGNDNSADWQGSQVLSLTSRDSTALMTLVGQLQERKLVVKRLAAQLSRETAHIVRDELVDEAIRRLKLRAERIAQTLDARVTRYDELRVEHDEVTGSQIQHFAGPGGSFSSATSPQPILEPGDATVSATLNAAVEMVPRRP